MLFHKHVVSALGIALFSATAPAVAAPAVSTPGAEQDSDSTVNEGVIVVGTALVAIADVNLSQASIRKGSKVLVTKVRDGQTGTTLDVQLPDGHVLRRIALGAIKSSFRVES